jgi:hypothetical protein
MAEYEWIRNLPPLREWIGLAFAVAAPEPQRFRVFSRRDEHGRTVIELHVPAGESLEQVAASAAMAVAMERDGFGIGEGARALVRRILGG